MKTKRITLQAVEQHLPSASMARFLIEKSIEPLQRNGLAGVTVVYYPDGGIEQFASAFHAPTSQLLLLPDLLEAAARRLREQLVEEEVDEPSPLILPS